MKLPKISKVTTGVVLGLGLLAASGQSQAALLGVSFSQAEPDILSQFIDFNYDASSDSLTASGFALELLSSGSNAIASGDFNLSATIDDTGAISGGTLSITGTIAALGFNSGSLLTGALTEFGFDANGQLDFLFTVTGGDAAALYNANGTGGGIIISDSGFSGDFASDWDNTGGFPGFGTGQADVGVVPVPAAVWLFGSGLIGLVGVARRSSKKQA